jgi:hypothetical protein
MIPHAQSRAPVAARGQRVAAVVVAIACGCGREEPPGASELGVARDPRTPFSGPGLQPPPASGELAPLFAPRPPAMPPEVARALQKRDPTADGWPCVARVDAAQVQLRRILEAHAAGWTPHSGAELSRSALLPEFPGLGVAAAAVPRVEVEAVAYDELGEGTLEVQFHVSLRRDFAGGEQRGRAELAVLSRDEAWRDWTGAFQLDYELRTLWRIDEKGHSLIEAQRTTPAARAPVATRPIFEERTRQAFAVDPAYEEELLRGPDAYYFHSDRLSGYDLICNHGLAVGDIDGDGWEDVYVCMAPGLPNRLYLRGPSGGVRDVAPALGVAYLDSTRSALILDLDGDGRRDLACAVGGVVLVHWNESQGLSQPTQLRGKSGEDIFSMAAADFDGDGDLDLFACRYSAQGVMQGFPTPYHDARNGAPNVLWRNEGERRFVDATAEAGMDTDNTRYSFAAAWEDFDDDGDPDLYVANDFGPNHYWVNEGGRFRDLARELGAEDMAAGMGVAVGDVDGDGDFDLYVSNMYAAEGLRSTSRAERFLAGRPAGILPLYARHARGNTLLVQRGEGRFEDRGTESGAARGGWAWGAQFLDADNDGDLDIYSPNGFAGRRVDATADEFFWRHVIQASPVDGAITQEYHDAWFAMQYLYFELGHGWNGEERNVLFLGDGKGAFVDASGISGADLHDDARALVAIDWDRDGFEDLLLKNRNAPRLRLLRNAGNPRGARAWTVVELSQPGTANVDAIGARVRVHTDAGSFVRGVRAGDGFLVQSPSRVHFGLGRAERIDAIEVRWPDGGSARFEGPFEPGSAWRIERGAATPTALAWKPPAGWADAPPRGEQALPGIAGRTVLFDKLPLAPLTLPAFAGGQRRVHDFAGRPLLVTLWSVSNAAARQQMEHFARRIDALDERGPLLVPLAIDKGAGLVEARRLCETLGLERDAGFVDGWTLSALEVLLLEVYHRPETNPVPTSLLIDRAGQLCVVYQGPVQVERVLADTEVLQQMDPRQGSCARLQRGRWFERPRRDLRTLEKVFTGLGYPEFAGYYAEFIAQGR